MLTADLVTARRQKGELRVPKLDEKARARGEELAAAYLEVARASVGKTREEIEAAWDEVDDQGPHARLSLGLRKLVEDACGFESGDEVSPPALRRALFLRASEVRAALEDGGAFDRAAVVEEVAQAHGMDAAALERALYADLRSAQILEAAPVVSAESLVAGFDLAQVQAVLLRAVKVVLEIACHAPGATRAFFRKLKFLRLLHKIEPLEGGAGYRVEVDGPYSLFESVTKYGLSLALMFPALAEVDAWKLEADVLWGKQRERLVFRAAGHRPEAREEEASGRAEGGAHLADETRALLEAFGELETPWRAKVATDVLDLPGVGIVVPDLVFTREGARGRKVYLEVLGFWSRDAVWRRVEIAQKGLPHPVLFAVSARLRVSEDVLPEESGASLYVYKGVMSARAIEKRLDQLAARAG